MFYYSVYFIVLVTLFFFLLFVLCERRMSGSLLVDGLCGNDRRFALCPLFFFLFRSNGFELGEHLRYCTANPTHSIRYMQQAR